jgi:hypothetical protein
MPKFSDFITKIEEEKEEKDNILKAPLVQEPAPKTEPVVKTDGGDESSEDAPKKPQGSFSERLAMLGRGWTYSANFNGSAHIDSRWELSLKGPKGQRFEVTGETFPETLGVLVANARNKKVEI